MQEKLRVGRILTTHGLRGEVKVYPTTEDPGRFRELLGKTVYLSMGSRNGMRRNAGNAAETDGLRTVEIRSVRFQQEFVLLGFTGLDRIEDVQGLRQADILIDRKDAIPLGTDEWFIGDLIGLRVITDEEEELGEVSEVMETGANRVLIVRNGSREILIPKIPPCILKIDPEEGFIRVHLLPGLLDL